MMLLANAGFVDGSSIADSFFLTHSCMLGSESFLARAKDRDEQVIKSKE